MAIALTSRQVLIISSTILSIFLACSTTPQTGYDFSSLLSSFWLSSVFTVSLSEDKAALICKLQWQKNNNTKTVISCLSLKDHYTYMWNKFLEGQNKHCIWQCTKLLEELLARPTVCVCMCVCVCSIYFEALWVWSSDYLLGYLQHSLALYLICFNFEINGKI